MYSKRKQKRKNIRRWDYMWPDPQDSRWRGGIWKRRRLCTAYINDDQNWLYSNYSYFREINENYEAMWKDYHGLY